MAKLERTITINAPVEKVYGYLIQPANLPEIWPSMVEVKDVKDAGSAGATFNWIYKMAGIRMEGTTKYTEVIPCQYVVTKSHSSSGVTSDFEWTYQPENGGTRLRLQVEYTVPLPVLGKLAEAFIVKQNENEADTLLANLKARMEA